METQNLSSLNLSDDFQKVLPLDEAKRWSLEFRPPLEIVVIMSPLNVPNEKFMARFQWREYPQDAPSLKFIDPNSDSLNVPSAWPKLPGFRPNNLDACVNWTSEGFALHPEWRNDVRYRWDERGNVLLKVLRYLQDELDLHFQGRFR